MPSDYTIVDIVEEPHLEHGKPAAKLRVQFRVGDDGPFFERFAKDGTTDFDIRQRLETFARLIRGARG